MRNIFPLMIAVSLTAAAPAAAQGTDNSVNADTTAAATSNDTAATDSMTVTTDPAMAGSANDMAAVPATDQPIDSSYGEPAPAKKGGFPWGVLGVLGLLGLIPRKSR